MSLRSSARRAVAARHIAEHHEVRCLVADHEAGPGDDVVVEREDRRVRPARRVRPPWSAPTLVSGPTAAADPSHGSQGSAHPSYDRKRLRAGATLELLVSKRDRIGKYTRFRIRRGRAPQRFDTCLRFGATRGTRCPAASSPHPRPSASLATRRRPTRRSSHRRVRPKRFRSVTRSPFGLSAVMVGTG